MADDHGNRISFSGSPNETESGWSRNYERFHVFRSWVEPGRVENDADHFERLWNDQSPTVSVRPTHEAYITHLRRQAPRRKPTSEQTDGQPEKNQREAYWQTVQDALRNDPATTAATVPTVLWPHQAAFFNRHATEPGPDRLLIADEVGLGKTIQAGILTKLRMNQGKVNRILILAPKPACPQWQDELHRKFCIDLPTLETNPRPLLRHSGGQTETAPNPPWQADRLIASYQWLRTHADEFLKDKTGYDMVIVDEVHRARFSEVDNESKRRPNQYLKLLEQLAQRTESLLLLTATPMQMHEAELLALLEMLRPTGWTPQDFRDFYDAGKPANPNQWHRMAELYRPHSPDSSANDEKLIHNPNHAYVASQLQKYPNLMADTAKLMRERSPAKSLMTRHTRETLRRYAREGRIKAVIPERRIHPIAVTMNADTRRLYDSINDLVRQVYADDDRLNATALGFIMTIYRRRLGSSPRAFAQTCRNHLERKDSAGAEQWLELNRLDPEELEDLVDERLPTGDMTTAKANLLLETAVAAEEMERRDPKLRELRQRLEALKADGHRKIIVFTQFRDTLLYLEPNLTGRGYGPTTCISGQDEKERGDRRARVKAMMEADDGILICTETASESLNLQFCTAIVNYDMPWNPMTLEQRIGRIDRIGQERDIVDVINLFYEDTTEWDAYEAMQERLSNIHEHVGKYQPILNDPATAKAMYGIISRNAGPEATRAAVASVSTGTMMRLDQLNSTPDDSVLPVPQVNMTFLQRALEEPELMTDDWTVSHKGGAHWKVTGPNRAPQLVTTNIAAYEYAPEYVDWWNAESVLQAMKPEKGQRNERPTGRPH